MRDRKYSTNTSYEFSTQEDGVTIPDDKTSLEVWPLLLSNWEQYKMSNNYQHMLHDTVRKGIPFSIRGEAWKIMSGGNELKKKNPGVYEVLVTKESFSESCLKKDIHRTYPQNKNFRLEDGLGQTAMYNVLKVYSIMDPEVGYCQGMSFICGVLIHHNMSEVDAFWSLSAMLRGFNLRGFFLDDLPLLKLFVFRFTRLFQMLLPSLSNHFKQYSVDSLFFCAEWFNTLFAYSVPMETTSRIWDVFFLEGSNFFLCVALAILDLCADELLRCDGFDKIMQYLKLKTSSLSSDVIKEASKFGHIYELLPKIDTDYENGMRNDD